MGGVKSTNGGTAMGVHNGVHLPGKGKCHPVLSVDPVGGVEGLGVYGSSEAWSLGKLFVHEQNIMNHGEGQCDRLRIVLTKEAHRHFQMAEIKGLRGEVATPVLTDLEG